MATSLDTNTCKGVTPWIMPWAFPLSNRRSQTGRERERVRERERGSELIHWGNGYQNEHARDKVSFEVSTLFLA